MTEFFDRSLPATRHKKLKLVWIPFCRELHNLGMLDVLRCPATAHVQASTWGGHICVPRSSVNGLVETAKDLLELRKNCSVWKEGEGADENHVLDRRGTGYVLPARLGAPL